MSTSLTPAQMLQSARLHLLQNNPFWGYIAVSLNFKERPEVGTAGVDGSTNMYYAPDFIKGKTKQELVFLIAHELKHLIDEHFIRRGARQQGLWNIAADHSINTTLDKEKIGTFIKGGCKDDKYLGWNAEAIYEDLEKNGGGGEGWDNHDFWGKGEGGEPLTPEQLQEAKIQIQQAVVQAAHAARQAGKDVPDSYKWLLEELTEQKVDWRSLVIERIKEKVKEEVSWKRVNRRRSLGEFNYPGVDEGENVSFAVFFDTSGSIGKKETEEFLSNVYRATEDFTFVTVDVACWDTKVYNHSRFTTENAQEMLSYEFQGGGGTDAKCIFNWLNKRIANGEKAPAQIFVFSDMEFSYFDDPMIAPVTWISLFKNKEAPFGEIVDFN